MTDRHPEARNGLRFLARCAAVLPALWLALLLLALPFGGGGHPSLTSLVIIVPASVSLTGRAISALMGDPGASELFWTLLVFGTVVELAFAGVVAGLAVRSLLDRGFRRRSAWFGCALIYVACHVYVGRLVTSRAVTAAMLSASSPEVRHPVLERISFLSKVLCDLSLKSADLQRAPGVDYTRLTESFASLTKTVYERMMAELPSRRELLNPIVGIALNNPELGRAEVDRLFELLQRPSIAQCVRLPMSFRK